MRCDRGTATLGGGLGRRRCERRFLVVGTDVAVGRCGMRRVLLQASGRRGVDGNGELAKMQSWAMPGTQVHSPMFSAHPSRMFTAALPQTDQFSDCWWLPTCGCAERAPRRTTFRFQHRSFIQGSPFPAQSVSMSHAPEMPLDWLVLLGRARRLSGKHRGPDVRPHKPRRLSCSS